MPTPLIPRELAAIARRTRRDLVAATGLRYLTQQCVAAAFALRSRAAAAGIAVDVDSGGIRTSRVLFDDRRESVYSPLVSHAWAKHGDVIIDLTATQFWCVADVYMTRNDDRYVGGYVRNAAVLGMARDEADVARVLGILGIRLDDLRALDASVAA